MVSRWIGRVFRIVVFVSCVCSWSGAQAERPPQEPARKEIKILGIGNSFTGNVFSLLQPMGEHSREYSLILGHGIIGGCSMKKHMTLANLHESEPDSPEGRAYSIWVTGDSGERTRVKVGLKDGIRVGNLSDEDAKFLSRIAHQVVREGKRPAIERPQNEE